ncbi:MAG TPA: vanadium-dependent haloperoxidase [Polyangiaceae bacterium]|nr:vanadium-dependent haloperoxidase [Polyangiaceae bacterium]
MRRVSGSQSARAVALAAVSSSLLATTSAFADAVSDWNQYTIEATKGYVGSSTAGAGVTLDTNLATRIEAIEARAVFDAVNSIDHFNPGAYYYSSNQAGAAAAAAITAAHDVILGELPNPASDSTADPHWTAVRTWVDSQYASDLSALGVSNSDGGVAAGHAAASAAIAARSIDGASPNTSYGAQLTPTTNPGIGVWRQSNAGAPYVSPTTGAPTGFDSTGTVIQGKPGIDLNWRDLAPFSLTTPELTVLTRLLPLSPEVGSREYTAELAFATAIGKDTSSTRTADETAQALFYKQDAEIFVNEAARIASAARNLSLDQNAALFALLDNAVADARIGAWISKYYEKFWRPITSANADSTGAVTNAYVVFHPLAATPSHPSNTSGHSSTGASAAEILRAFFGDRISPDGKPVVLGSLPWLAGTNSGTGKTTSRSVSTFTQLQLETGASRLYLGVHYGTDNLQGQLIGLEVADAVLRSNDPAARGFRVPDSSASLYNLERTLLSRRDLYGFYGFDAGRR